MQQLLRTRSIQAKLSVNEPGDRYEQEADRVADQVMRMMSASAGCAEPPPSIQRACTSCAEEMKEQSVQRMCDECEEEVQRRESNHVAPQMTTAVESQILALQSGGEPLSAQTRSFFEPRFNRDFSDVRVHADRSAAETAESVNALAYTRGNHIVFQTGQYQPNTPGGQRLLAHELTHVVQQNHANKTAPNVQRVIGDPSQAPANLACDIANSSPANVFSDIYFPISSNVLDEESVAKIAGFIATWEEAGAEDPIRIDGFASTDGPEPLNWTLSCNRAQAVRNELEHPTAGTGIPAGFITEVFANGETDQFGTALQLNRRALISADLTEPPACEHPGVIRTLDLQPVFLRTDPTDASPTGTTWATRLATANDIWGKVGVSFIELSPITIDTPLKTNGTNNAEIAAVQGLRSAAGVEIFLVDNDMITSGGAATAFDAATNTGCGPAGNIVMSDRGTSNTLLAHELGHVLGLDHPQDLPPLNPGDPNTIMEASGSNSIANPTRNTIVNYSRILCPDPVGSVCLNPDT